MGLQVIAGGATERRQRLPWAKRGMGGWLAIALIIMSSAVPGGFAQTTPSVVAQFTTGIEDREPVDQITFVKSGVEKVYFFTDLRGLNGQTIQHRWVHAGEMKAAVFFEVRGPRWRVWSSKELLPDWIGDWTVEIVTSEGEVLAAETFTYSAPDA